MERQNCFLNFKKFPLAGAILFYLVLTSCAYASQSVSLLHGYTPFNSQNVAMNGIKYQLGLGSLSWVDGVNVTAGQFSGPWNWQDTSWLSVGAYWQFWHSSFGHVELEFAPTYLEHQHVAGHLVGSDLHFNSTLSYWLEADVLPVKVGAFYQHTSSADLGSPNPGIDTLGISLRMTW